MTKPRTAAERQRSRRKMLRAAGGVELLLVLHPPVAQALIRAAVASDIPPATLAAHLIATALTR